MPFIWCHRQVKMVTWIFYNWNGIVVGLWSLIQTLRRRFHFFFFFFFAQSCFRLCTSVMLTCVLAVAELRFLLLWSFPRSTMVIYLRIVIGRQLACVSVHTVLSCRNERMCLWMSGWDVGVHGSRQSSHCCCHWAPRVVLIFVRCHLEPRFADGFPDRKLVFSTHLVCCPTCGAFVWLQIWFVFLVQGLWAQGEKLCSFTTSRPWMRPSLFCVVLSFLWVTCVMFYFSFTSPDCCLEARWMSGFCPTGTHLKLHLCPFLWSVANLLVSLIHHSSMQLPVRLERLAPCHSRSFANRVAGCEHLPECVCGNSFYCWVCTCQTVSIKLVNTSNMSFWGISSFSAVDYSSWF